jgi:hypothetical protein
MPRTLHVDVELSVNDEADPTAVADWLFALLADTPDDAWDAAVDSVDGTTPDLRGWL